MRHVLCLISTLSKLTKSIALPVKMTSKADIDALIQQLDEIKAQLALYAEIDVRITLNHE